MRDYNKGKIYAIIPNGVKLEDTDGDVYIGSTAFVNLQTYFKSHHVNDYVYKTATMRKSSKLLFEKFGIEGCEIILIENYACENRKELERKEGEYQRKIKCVNIRIAGRNRQEFQIENRDRLREIDRLRNLNRLEYNHKRSAEYYQKNKAAVSERKKELYKINKEVIREKNKERIVCECGTNCSRNDKTRHIKTKKHATLMEALQQQAQACP